MNLPSKWQLFFFHLAPTSDLIEACIKMKFAMILTALMENIVHKPTSE